MTRRALRIELIRTAGRFSLALFAFTAVLLYAAPDWAGNWSSLAHAIRASLAGGLPLVAAHAAWIGGRERRRRISDLLGSTPRPGWQPLVVTWAALTCGATSAVLACWLLGAAFVGPVATYVGTGWQLSLVIVVCGTAATSAMGLVCGRLLPWTFTPALVWWAGFTGLDRMDESRGVLLQPTLTTIAPEFRKADLTMLLQIGWFVALTAACLALLGLRRKLFAAFPVAVAALMMGAVLMIPPDRNEIDPAARPIACIRSGLEICTWRSREFLLDDYEPLQHPLWTRLREVPGAPRSLWYDKSSDLPGYPVTSLTLTGHFADPVEAQWRLATDLIVSRCEIGSGSYPGTDRWVPSAAAAVAEDWLLHGIVRDKLPLTRVPQPPDPLVRRVRDRLLSADIHAQRHWMARYFAATSTEYCDMDALERLLEI